jgi:NAD/NADP octopine/nopaline dehydrogenase-like protein
MRTPHLTPPVYRTYSSELARLNRQIGLSPTRIRPIVRKRWLQIATLPGNRIGEVFPRLSPLFPEAVAAPNILYTGFTNANAMLHVANCVANAGRIESGDSYKFYAEGVTPAVAQL